ncbi:hypothetical protein [Rhodococcus sp. NPDC059234]|uniref:Rv2732c family membrane protein n=1 Tax=Rhodococcus sp. NPDC059234 TaxID=3346781 RepID=UPI00366DBA65
MTDDLSAYRDELAAIERRVAGEFSFGRLLPVAAGAVGLLATGYFLPHAGGASAFSVLTSPAGGNEPGATVPLRIYLVLVAVFGVGASAVALCSRRWAMAWVAMVGNGIATVFGLLACWSQQSLPEQTRPPGLASGLLVTWAVTAALAVLWASVVWSRANIMQDAPAGPDGLDPTAGTIAEIH